MANLLINTTVGGNAVITTSNIGTYALTSITSGNVTTALGFTPYNATNPSGYISSITSGNVTTALGYTPYNATNPSGYITSSNNYYYVNPGNGYGIGFWGQVPTTYGITMANESAGYGVIYGLSEYHLYFSMTGGGNRGFVFRNDAYGAVTQIGNYGWQMWRGELYPGYNNSSSGSQTSYYIYGNTNNAGLRTNGNWLVNGNLYIGSRDVWFSDWFNQDVRTSASPSFSTVNLNTLNASDTNARYYYQSTNGVPSNNLGNPTVTEMALFHEQFNNKTAFYDNTALSFWTSSDGVNFTEYTGFDTTTKKRFLGGDTDSGVFIPNLTNRFRVEVENTAGYVFLNQLYIYWSSNSHSSKVHIWVRRCDNNQWYQWTDSNTQVSSWPGHLYLPFGGIPFYPGALASTGHYNRIRIEFIPTWSSGTYSYTNINLYRMQIWGGYPAGKRNIYSVDENRNVTFPTEVGATAFYATDFRAANAFYLNGTSYFLNSTNGGIYTNARFESGNSIHSVNFYAGDWFRNNSSNTGLYNQTNGNHFYSRGATSWGMTFAGNSSGAFGFWRNHESSEEGNIYFNTEGFGLLNRNGNWALRTDRDSTNVRLFYAGSERLRTDSSGAYVTGRLDVSNYIYTPQHIIAKNIQGPYQVLNLDTIKEPGLYQYDGGIGGTQPAGTNWSNVKTIEIGSDNRYSQFVMPYSNSRIFYRIKIDAGWQSYVELVTSGNIGSQSVSYATTAGALSSMNISQFSNNSGYLTGITSGQVTGALGYTPYNASNPSSYITSGDTTTGIFTTFLGNATSNIGSGYTRVIRNENGAGGAPNYAPILHVAASDTMWQIAGAHAGQTTLVWRSGYSGAWNTPWWTIYHSGNFTDNSSNWNTAYSWGNHASAGYQAASTAITTSNIGSQSVSNATTAGGLAVHGGRNNEANKIVRTDVNGYLQTGWINTPSGAFGSAINKIYCSDDDYVRYQTPANFISNLGLITTSSIGNQSVSYAVTAGSAGSVTGLTLNNSASGINPDNVTQNQIGYNTSVSLFGQTDGGLYSSAYSSSWIHQIYGDFRTGQIAIRGKNSGSWQAWRVVLDSSNYTSYAPSLTGSGASGSWGISVTGSAGSVAWTNVSSRPTALSQFSNDLGNYGGFLTSITAHSHAISDVTGLQTALDGKQASLGFTPYNSTNPSGYITSSGSISGNSATATALTSMNISQFTNNSGYITGYTETNTFLGDGGNADTHPGTSRLIFTGQISSGAEVLGMPANDNSNAFLNINRHSGEYNSQLGFSSNGSMYYRSFSATVINNSQAWRQVWDSGNLTNLNQLTNGPGYITSSALSGYATQSWVNSQGFLTSLPSHNHDDRYYTETEINNFSYWRNNEERRIKILRFTGEGGDSANTTQSYAIYQAGGAWTHPYPDLRIAFHTGIQIGANSSYGGTRFYNEYDMATELMSVGNGDNHVRVANSLYVGGNLALHAGNYTSYSPSLTGSGASGSWGISVTGNAATATSAATVTGSSTINGYLTLNVNWGVSPYTSAFTIIGTHPSMTFRGSNGDTHYLMHMDSAGDIQYYFGPGYTTNNWTKRYEFTKGGNFTCVTGTISATNFSGSSSGINTGDQTNISGNAATATNVAYSGLTGTVPTWNQNTTGNAATATYATTAGSAPANGGNSATVGGYAVSGSVGANTVVIRDANNYIYAHYINSNVSETENPTINSFYTSNGDGWLRKSSVAHVKSQLGLGSMAYESSGTYQTVSGAINTGNIASQSVSYATISQQLTKFGDIYGQDWNSYFITAKLIVSNALGHTGANRPSDSYGYGTVLSYGETGGPLMQMYFPEDVGNTGGAYRALAYRSGFNGGWSPWKTVVNQVGNTCTVAGSNGTGLQVHSNVGYNQNPLTYFLLRGQADSSWKTFKILLTGDAGGQDIEFRRIAENSTDARMFYVPRGLNQVIFDYTVVQPSDSRLKDNLTPITNPVDKIKSLRGVEFDWNSGEHVGTHDVGLIAQDVEAVLPEAVTTQEDGYKNLAYTKVIPLLVEAMKEQQTMIEALRAEIELLKNK